MAKQMPIAINMKSANILFFAYHEISDIFLMEKLEFSSHVLRVDCDCIGMILRQTNCMQMIPNDKSFRDVWRLNLK